MARIHGKDVQVVGAPGGEGRPFQAADGSYYPIPTGASLTATAFESGLGVLGKWVVTLGIALLGLAGVVSRERRAYLERMADRGEL